MATKIAAGIISLEPELSECYRLLDGMTYNRKTVRKYIMRSASTGGRQYVKRNFRSVLHSRSGNLLKSITSYIDSIGYKITFTNSANSGKPTSKDGRLARYGFMLASGYDLKPKHAKALSWEYNGQRFFAKSVKVEAKDFTESPVDRYFDSADCTERMEKATQKQIDYWEKRAEEGR